MKRFALPVLLLALLLVGCQSALNEPELEAQSRHQLLQNIPVAGTVETEEGDVVGALQDGLLTITELGFANGVLTVAGTLSGDILDASGDVVQTLTNVLFEVTAELTREGPGNSCRILFLEIPGGIFLDALGLVVDLAPIELEVRAERGPGNLLGNLLCALTGLLDGGPLAGILNIIDRINNLLG